MQAIDASRQALVLDDEYLIAVDVEAILAEAGFAVMTAITVAEAIEFAARNALHIAVLDFRMEPAAHELAHRLRGDGIPVIFCTGALADEVHAVFPGAPIISKPFDAATLLDAVTRALA